MTDPFKLELFQRVTCKNGDEGIIVPGGRSGRAVLAICFIDGWADAVFDADDRFSSLYNIVAVYAEPESSYQMLNIDDKGELLWEAKPDKETQAELAVEAAKKSLEEAIATLAAIKGEGHV